MDPFSIIAGMAGIAAAGAALSKAIYEFVSSTRGASREMFDIAHTIADLSIILGELRRVMRDGSELCNRKYLRRIKSATRRISRVHREIHQLMDDAQWLSSFKWRLKRSEIREKLTRIECHKSAINMMLHILVLAITTRQQSGLSDTQPYKDGQQGQRHQEQDQEQDIYLLRQQSENLAYAAHQSLIDLSESQSQQRDSDLEQSSDGYSDQNNEPGTQLQVRVPRQRSDDTANWLLDLIFSPYAETRTDTDDQSSTNSDADSAASDTDNDAQEQPSESRKDSTSHSLVVSGPSENTIAIYDPGAAASVVKELLADWAVLTEKEIESTTGDRQCPEEKEVEPSEGSQNKDVFISFKDAVGRKFKFPFYRVKKFEGMNRLINAAFAKVDVLGPHVQKGHFDLIGPDDIIMLPEVWDDLIRPEMDISMVMWSLDELPPPKKSGTHLVRPTQPTNPGQSSSQTSREQSSQPKQPPHEPTTPRKLVSQPSEVRTLDDILWVWSGEGKGTKNKGKKKSPRNKDADLPF